MISETELQKEIDKCRELVLPSKRRTLNDYYIIGNLVKSRNIWIFKKTTDKIILYLL